MTRAEFAKGSAIFLAVIVAGFVSTTYLDRHFVGAAPTGNAGSSNGDEAAPAASSAACVGKDGTWKNWVWSNVPMLSPKCVDDR